ncbi:MAG: arginyltransferase [Polynucleobacter victoriensis]
MSKLKELPFTTLQFYATAPYSCSYLSDRVARSQVATPAHLINADLYGELVSNGFRRSGMYTYRPYCDGCKACTACRVNIQQFAPKRYQKRAFKKHQGLQAKVGHLAYFQEHYELYMSYQKDRHSGGGMDSDDQDQYQQFLLQSKVNTRLVEFRDGPNDPEPGKLRMVSIIDIIHDGLSSVYTFFDTSVENASYGTYCIMWQLEQAKKLNLPYLYLGYLIKESPKMAYKSEFEPLEILVDDHWQLNHLVNN